MGLRTARSISARRTLPPPDVADIHALALEGRAQSGRRGYIAVFQAGRDNGHGKLVFGARRDRLRRRGFHPSLRRCRGARGGCVDRIRLAVSASAIAGAIGRASLPCAEGGDPGGDPRGVTPPGVAIPPPSRRTDPTMRPKQGWGPSTPPFARDNSLVPLSDAMPRSKFRRKGCKQ